MKIIGSSRRAPKRPIRSIRPIRLAGLCVLAVLAGCGLFLSEEAQLERAQEAEKRGDLRAAAIDLKSLLEKHPKNREARFALGRVDLESGDFAAAVREFERARAEGVPNERVFEPLARAYLASGQIDQALALIDNEIRQTDASVAPDRASVNLRLRGEVLIAKRDFSNARTSFESALSTTPNDVRALLGLAGVMEATEGAAAALKITDRALAVAPENPSVSMARGGLFLQLRDPASAAQAFGKARELLGDSRKGELVITLAGLSQAQLAQGQISEALESTSQMQKIAPNALITRYTRAYALAQDGKLEEAQTLLEQNLSQGGDTRSRMLLGTINLMQGRLGQAEMSLASVVASEPNNAEARQLLAQARLQQSKPGEALDVLLPALDGDAVSSRMLALAGQASLASGKAKEGVALLKRNADAHPYDEGAQLDLAAGYVATGQADQALALLSGDKPAANEAAPAADKQPGKVSAEQSADQIVRREYLAVLARLQKGDGSGAVASAVAAAKQRPENPALQALAGSILTQQRQYAQARVYVNEVVRLRPNDSAGYVNLGRLDLLQGNVDAARQGFRTALKKKPGDAAPTMALALIEMSAQKPDAALEVLGESRKLNPKNIEPRVLETQLLLAAGRIDESEKLARETAELAPDDPSVLAGLGRVLSTRGQHRQAIEVFERAVQKQPRSAPLHFQLAIAQRMAGKLDDATDTVRTVMKLDDRHVPAKQMDGMLAVTKGNLTAASQRAEELLKIAPDQAATYELVAGLRAAQGRFGESAEALRRAATLDPRPQYAIAEYEVRVKGKLTAPEEPLEKYLAVHPDDVMTRITLAQAQQVRGDRVAAERSYQQVLSNQPRNPVALNNLAWMHHEDGKKDAVDLARKAHEVAPDSLSIVDTYAWILVNSGQPKEAVRLLDPLLNRAGKQPGQVSPEIRAHYAIALARAGRGAEAKALAKELTASDAAQLSSETRALVTDLMKS